MHRSRLIPLLFALNLVSSSAAIAASFIVPGDADMVRSAPVIVVGTAGVSSSFEQSGEIYTRTRLSIHESIRGALAPGQTIDVVGMGGAIDGRFEIVSGVPTFVEGERVLLFLTRNAHGQWAVKDLMLGKFTFADWEGERLLVRGVGSEHVFGWTPDGRLHDEPLRAATPFLEFVRSVSRDSRAIEANYIRTHNARGARITSDRFLEENAEPNAYLSTVLFNGQNIGFRWREFDDGGSVGFQRDGAQPGFDASSTAASIERAMAAWNNDGGSPVSYQLTGTTGAGFVINDGTNAVVFNKTFPAEAGAAVGFAKWSGGVVYTRSGSTFIGTTEGDVIIRNSISGETLLDEVLCHELGHTLGFRHSNEGSPSSNDAVMRSSASGSRGANLGSWDIEAVQTVYGAGAACTPPSITTHPQSATISSGQAANLSVVASGSAPFTYQWQRRTTGSFSPIGGATSASLNTGALTETTEFRVVVTNECGNVTSNTATITVQACDAPTFTGVSQNETLSSGQSTTVSVAVNGTNPIGIQWFRRTGTSGNFSSISGATSTSFNTGALSQTTQYFARATNACGSVDSTVITIEVTAVCQPVAITSQPQSGSISSGQSTTLSVGATGTAPISYQWFRRTGTSGSFSPIGGATSASVSTGALTETTQFFARVTNDCGTVDSSTATVTVTECALPSFTGVSQNETIQSGQSTTVSVAVTGTNPITIQWFRRTGTSGNFSTVSGGTSTSLVTGALAQTTQFFARATNSCGATDSSIITINVTTVCEPASITTQPQDVSLPAGGGAVSLSLVAGGTSPLTITWFRQTGSGSTQIGTGNSVSVTEAGTYFARVSNSCGTVDSRLVTVQSGCTAPNITQQPQSRQVGKGQTASLSVTATGTSLSYQWFEGTAGDATRPVAGATSPNFTTPALTQTTAYWVRVSNTCGTRNSTTATITVTASKKRGVKPPGH